MRSQNLLPEKVLVERGEGKRGERGKGGEMRGREESRGTEREFEG